MWKSEGGFESLESGLPVLASDLDVRPHEHKHWVLSDGEILGEGLLEVVVGSLHVATLTVDKSGKNVSLNHGWVFVQAVFQLLKSCSHVVSKPLCLRKKNLGLRQALVLLGHVFEELGSLD